MELNPDGSVKKTVRARYYPPDGCSHTQVPEDFRGLVRESWSSPAEAIAAIRGAAPVPPGVSPEEFCAVWYDEHMYVHVHESDREGCGGFALVWSDRQDLPVGASDMKEALECERSRFARKDPK